tara:strand:+ start:229 stop:1101 length:873 start_codon:yes stop_codon:yes gene_type:complete
MSQYKNKDLTIIIVIYNSTDKIIDLLHQLNNFEIIIVNNGKNEHVISKIKAHKNVKSIISKEKNIGFGRGVNFAFENIDSKYFLVLNPDILINENDILKLLDIIINDKSCGIVSPLISSDSDSFGAFPEKGKGVERNLNQIKCSKMLVENTPSGNCCVDVTKGCVLLINSEFFKKVGMFNEKFFLFWEEIDLCKKFRKAKLSVILVPEIKVIHEEGTSSKNNLSNFIIRTFNKEISPLIYFKSKKLNLNLLVKILKYFFRTFSYLIILNLKNSLKNFLKLIATLSYIVFK